jgi:hypothetical protein
VIVVVKERGSEAQHIKVGPNGIAISVAPGGYVEQVALGGLCELALDANERTPSIRVAREEGRFGRVYPLWPESVLHVGLREFRVGELEELALA